MAITLIPGGTSLAKLSSLYRDAIDFEIDPPAFAQVERGSQRLRDGIASGAAIYGVNTGFGKLASVRIDEDNLVDLQRNLVLSHSAGFGPPLPENVVRLIIALKCLSLARGASGVRPDVIIALERLTKAGVMPVIPSQGSVGASGDLAPLAHLASTLIGEGDAFCGGRRMSSRAALQAVGLEPIELQAKEGLALLNGTQVSTALGLAGLFGAWQLALASLTTAALSIDAAMGSVKPFSAEIHELRGHRGQVESAQRLQSLLDGSDIVKSHLTDCERVQDPYCLRCAPQVIGACIDQLRHAGRTLEIEANAVTDNPLVLADGDIVSGGNFHAEPVALVADLAAMAISEIGCIAQRRIALLVDPALSYGLPAFLAPDPGLTSGLMIAEVTSAALMSENKALANPRSVDSTPTSANQEDHVSMACHGARRLEEMNRNLAGIIGVEAMTAVQGIELRAPHQTSEELKKAMTLVRSASPALHKDRIVSGDINALAELVISSDALSNPGDGVPPIDLAA